MCEAYEPRSGCPINATIEVFGDRWSLLVLRDIVSALRLCRRSNAQRDLSSNRLTPVERALTLFGRTVVTRRVGAQTVSDLVRFIRLSVAADSRVRIALTLGPAAGYTQECVSGSAYSSASTNFGL